MRLLVPYVVRSPEIAAAAPERAEWVYVGGDDHAYWRVMAEAWERSVATGEDLMILEHDVVCRPDVVDQFEACGQPWCTFGYDTMCHQTCQEAWANQLGCTRFRADLIRACPTAVSSIPAELRLWNNLCDHIAGNKVNGTSAPLRPGSVRAAGFTHHWHEPLVTHDPEKGPIGDGYGRRLSWNEESVDA